MELTLEDSLNVFTDASTTKSDNRTISSPGYAIVYNNKIIKSVNRIFYNTTSNYGEMYAIIMALGALIEIKRQLNLKGMDMPTVNLFSDSEISILGLRKWIFNWWSNNTTQTFYSEAKLFSNQGILNKELFVTAVRMIVDNELPVNLYHTKAHVHISRPKEVINMIQKFGLINHRTINQRIACYLTYYNTFVDNMTRDNLKKVVYNSLKFDKDKYAHLNFQFMGFLTSDVMCKYACLINKD
jgi:ribonuclease H